MKFDPANPERIGDATRRVLEGAEKAAIARGSSTISPEDLLLALARGDRKLGRALLEGFSIDLDQLEPELACLAPQHAEPSPPAAAEFSPDTLRVLARAKEEAAALEQNYLVTEHLVLALLGDATSRAGSFLRERGASIDQAREILRTFLDEVSPP